MTQKQTAKTVGIHKSYFCQILAGAVIPSEELSLKLERATGVRSSLWMRGNTAALRRAWKKYQEEYKEEKRFIEEYNRRKARGLI